MGGLRRGVHIVFSVHDDMVYSDLDGFRGLLLAVMGIWNE